MQTIDCEILEAEKRFEKTLTHQCVVSSSAFSTLDKREAIDGEWMIIDVNVIRHYPSLNIFYDTLTKKGTQEERRGIIIGKLYELGFEASPYNNDLALNKFYSLEGSRARIRVELARNGIVHIFIFIREEDKTMSITEFFEPTTISTLLHQFLDKDEIRNLTINKILK